MDVGRDIDEDNRPATRPERWFTWTEISASVVLAFAVAIVVAVLAVFFLVDVVVSVVTQ